MGFLRIASKQEGANKVLVKHDPVLELLAAFVQW
jgi:hypothetical protein